MRVAVFGATGFVGRQLIPVLAERGHDVVALTRGPEDYDGAGSAHFADLDDPGSLPAALHGCAAAYLLSHSLGSKDFEQRESEQAAALGGAAATCGLNQLIMLSGLGRDDDRLSAHLRSRRQVEHVLQAGSVPVTVLRAGILIGAGSTGWEMLRQTVEALPVMVTDLRARTSHQSIGVDDAVGFLADALGNDACLGQTLEIGGSDVLSYVDMVRRVAELTGSHRPVELPWVPHFLSAAGVSVLTDVDGSLAQDLLDSMGNEAIVTTDVAQRILPRTVMGFDEAVRRALSDTRGTPSA